MQQKRDITRREFMQTTTVAGAASAFMIVKPESVRGTQANDAVTIGWVGAGGRGTADASGLTAAGARIVAVADVFREKLDAASKRFNLEDSSCYLGFDGYKKVFDSKADAVLLTSPPGFRPAEIIGAVEAGKHVFAEKPVAVDAWGCRAVLDATGKAATKKLSVVVGLQRRYSKAYREAQSRITSGALGTIVAGRGFYLTQDVWRGRTWPRGDFDSELLWMTKNWYYFRSLSGDLITEQNIHNLDACNWVLGGHPERCTGFGGRKWRTYIGDIFDHFNVTYEYPGGVHLTFMSGQFCTFHDASEQILGSDSTFTNSGKIMKIEGKSPWEWSGEDNANRNEYEAFIASVRNGQPLADGQHAVDGTFTTILGREAAYRRREVQWKELWDENQKYERQAYPVA